MSYKQPVPSSSALPTTGNTTGDLSVALDTGAIYEWNGTSWVSQTAVASVKASPPTQSINYVYVDLISGNDNNNGSAPYPWKTIQKAYNSISPSINVPYVIKVSGGNNDTDSSPITGKPNVSIVADYQIQLQAITISGGTSNDNISFTNITFLGPVTWVRNDTSAMGIQFVNCEFFSGPILKQDGAGTCGVTAFNTVFVNADFKLNTFGFFFACSFLGSTTTFEDGGGGGGFFYIQFSGCYNSSAMTITGQVSPVYFSGFIQDVTFGASLTFASGTSGIASVETDSAGLPPSFTGSPSAITLLSQAQNEAYSPAVPGNWSVVPTTVAQALDRIAAKIGPV